MTTEFKQWSTIPAISAKWKSASHLKTLNTKKNTYIGSRIGYKPIGPIFHNWARAGVIYSQLFKYTQQHTAGFTENDWVTHLLRLILTDGNACLG